MTKEEFKTACITAWGTNGEQHKDIYDILNSLTNIFVFNSQDEIFDEAWKIYNSDPTEKKYVEISVMGGQRTKIIAANVVEAYHIAKEVGWSPDNILPA